jgi:hypothetical protein
MRHILDLLVKALYVSLVVAALAIAAVVILVVL